MARIRQHIIVPFFVLPSIFLGKQRAGLLEQLRQSYLAQAPTTLRVVSITTHDGCKLDGMMWRHPLQNEVPPNAQKWIVFCNPNGATCEEEMPFLVKYGSEVGVSVIGFNYRGVVHSGGVVHTAWDLIADGEAVMRYLIDQGVQSHNILLHGHSMGCLFH